MTDRTRIAIANSKKVACSLLVGIFTLTSVNSKSQGHAHVDCEYLANVYRVKIAIAHSQEVACDLSVGIYTFDLGPFFSR